MSVSDKDFDQLFQSKLGDMEMEPSAMVWNNIADELDGKGKNKKGLPWMQIAAAIVVVMGASLFFLSPDPEKITLRGHNATEVVTAKSATTAPEDMVINPANVAADQTTKPVKYTSKQVIAKQQIITVETKPVDTAQHVAIAANTVTTLSPVNTQPVIAQAQVHHTDVSTPALKTTDIPAKPANILASNKAIATKPAEEPVKRKRIHSLGDLLNVVIAKVDKRPNKVIEFTNTSDDDSFNITGLNLGIVRAKKEN